MIYPLDTETYPIWPGRTAPPIVCLQDDRGIHVGGEIRARFVEALRSGAVLVGHVIAYDLAVLGVAYPDLLVEIFDALADDRVTCTRVREKLVAIARGAEKGRGYSLVESCEAHGIDHGYHVDATGQKAEAWRVRYAELEGTPVADWPRDAVRYAQLDVSNLRALYDAQERVGVDLTDQYRQTRADWALHLMTCWGVVTDRRAVDALIDRIEREHVEARDRLVAAGLVRSHGARDTKAASDYMERARGAAGQDIERTATGRISLAADTCTATIDPSGILRLYARYGSIGILRSRAERLMMGTRTPLQPRYDVLKETGRTSCSQGTHGVQIQNFHREPGLRECIVPRPGNVLISVDYTGAELHTWAQVCLDLRIGSAMADALNSGHNAHDVFAADLLGWTHDEFVERRKEPEAKRMRQMAKAANFGFPGGLGAQSFRTYAASTYGVELDEFEARGLKDAWRRRYPEHVAYFAIVDRMVERGSFPHLRSDRWRGGASFCAAANSLFQGLAADMAKDAIFELAWACYVGPLSPARPVAFIHDEVLVESPRDRGDEIARGIQAIMEAAGRRWCPDVPPKTEASIMLRWSKSAEPRFDEEGRLIPWD